MLLKKLYTKICIYIFLHLSMKKIILLKYKEYLLYL